jgi:hypothetical protein
MTMNVNMSKNEENINISSEHVSSIDVSEPKAPTGDDKATYCHECETHIGDAHETYCSKFEPKDDEGDA